MNYRRVFIAITMLFLVVSLMVAMLFFILYSKKDINNNGILNKEVQTKRPIGLVNRNNTCYFNSLVQSLYHSGAKDFFIENDFPKDTVGLYLKEIFNGIKKSKTKVFDSSSIYKKILAKLSNITFGKQHDPFEILSNIFINLEMDCTKPQQDQLNKYFLTDPDGVIKYIIPVFFDFEDDEEYYIQYYKNDYFLTRKYLPKILILFINRCSYNGDIKVFRNNVVMHHKLEVNQREYQLKSFIEHYGKTALSGHYIAKIEYNKKWYEINDKNIEEIRNATQSRYCVMLIYQLTEV